MQEQTFSNNAVVTRFRLCPPQVDESHVVISVSTSLSVNSAPNRDKKSKTTPLDQPKPSCNDTTLHQTQADSVHQKKETMQMQKKKKKKKKEICEHRLFCWACRSADSLAKLSSLGLIQTYVYACHHSAECMYLWTIV